MRLSRLIMTSLLCLSETIVGSQKKDRCLSTYCTNEATVKTSAISELNGGFDFRRRRLQFHIGAVAGEQFGGGIQAGLGETDGGCRLSYAGGDELELAGEAA